MKLFNTQVKIHRKGAAIFAAPLKYKKIKTKNSSIKIKYMIL